MIISVVSKEYMRLASFWGSQVNWVSGRIPNFFCSDVESKNYLDVRGFNCHLCLPGSDLSTSDKLIYKKSTFPNDKAAFTVSLKMSAALMALRSGRSVLYSDVDAIWLKDPLSALKEIKSDFAFQPGSFPNSAKTSWGFTVCTGFFLLHPGANAERLLSEALHCFDGSDQRAVNEVLLTDFEIAWSEYPKNWENCSIKGGWTAPVIGHCGRSDFSLTALPHAFYQRHGTRREDCGHVIICHPNSRKDEADKIETLKVLGIEVAIDK